MQRISRRPVYRSDAVVAAFRRAASGLLDEAGAPELVRNIRLRFCFRDSMAILRAAFGGPVPARFHLGLLPRPRWLGRHPIRWMIRPRGHAG